MRPTLRFGSVLAVLVMALTACSGKDPYDPGAKLGTFHVAAKLVATSCGAATDPWEFDVRLNHDGSTLYWIQGGVPVQGQIDAASATANLQAQATTDLRAADAQAKLAACSVVRTDRLAVVMTGADAKPAGDASKMASFAGNLAYTFAPTDGSDCNDQLADSGGGFAALPCEIRYDIAGTLKSGP